ncbi:MAG: response regulator [Pseudomonadota bacterium]
MNAPSIAARVLIVDDHVDCAESLAQLLGMAGYDVRIAHDGLQAVALAEAWRPQAIVLDIALPGIDGHEVGRRIRASGWGAYALLIGVSGWDEDFRPGKPGSAGFDHRMVKPIDFDALERLLPSALSAPSIARAG